MQYDKPHLPYDQQVNLLRSRGLEIEDLRGAVQALKSIGYYRLSAYTYVLRDHGAPVTGLVRPPRADRFIGGAKLGDALRLHQFDQELRKCLLDGLQQVEVGLRVQIGYQLGKADPFAHLDRKFLDETACAAPSGLGGAITSAHPIDAYDDWLIRFDRLQREAKGEEYVKHFLTKYDGILPIWVATEFMTFGCLTRLFSLLNNKDATKIAENLQVKERKVLHSYLKALNVLRNHCAHNARIWNRSTTYPPGKPPLKLVNERLHHLTNADANKIYFLATLCAHLSIVLNPTSNWPRQFKTALGKFPSMHGMTPENMMGFTAGWDQLPIWNYDREVYGKS